MDLLAFIDKEIYSKNVKLSSDSFVIWGVGGVGSWVALLLALSGIANKIMLVDGDVVEYSNLNRTPYRITDVGKLKVEAMTNLILERRPNISILPHPEYVNESGIVGILETVDFFEVIDCRDTASIYGRLVGGYDGNNISISSKEGLSRIMDSGAIIPTTYRLNSWVVPPLLIALLIVLAYSKQTNLPAFNKTINVYEILDFIVGRKTNAE